eukprot:6468738-Amphidinium_carterae.1
MARPYDNDYEQKLRFPASHNLTPILLKRVSAATCWKQHAMEERLNAQINRVQVQSDKMRDAVVTRFEDPCSNCINGLSVTHAHRFSLSA